MTKPRESLIQRFPGISMIFQGFVIYDFYRHKGKVYADLLFIDVNM